MLANPFLCSCSSQHRLPVTKSSAETILPKCEACWNMHTVCASPDSQTLLEGAARIPQGYWKQQLNLPFGQTGCLRVVPRRPQHTTDISLRTRQASRFHSLFAAGLCNVNAWPPDVAHLRPSLCDASKRRRPISSGLLLDCRVHRLRRPQKQPGCGHGKIQNRKKKQHPELLVSSHGFVQ